MKSSVVSNICFWTSSAVKQSSCQKTRTALLDHLFADSKGPLGGISPGPGGGGGEFPIGPGGGGGAGGCPGYLRYFVKMHSVECTIIIIDVDERRRPI